MNAKKWVVTWAALTVTTLILIGGITYWVDPFFHFHKPYTNLFYYNLDNERSQNDGICKNFVYDALITGTSMTQNFKTSEMDKIWGTNSIKVPFPGASFHEINNNVSVALEHNENIKYVIRGLDYNKFLEDKDEMRLDLGDYPNYLYDANPFNDVYYLYNMDVLAGRVVPMLSGWIRGESGGITSFDEYAAWGNMYPYGRKTIGFESYVKAQQQEPISEEEWQIVKENIEQNVTSIADAHPEVEFYLFFTPYCAIYWMNRLNEGEFDKQIACEQYVIELLLEHPNIHLYSFNNCTDITTDLNNYKDALHYGDWVNDLMLSWMHDGKYMLTKENYKEYLDQERLFYETFDYDSLHEQEDYEDDLYAAELLIQKYGAQ